MNKYNLKKERKDKRVQVRVSYNELDILNELCKQTKLSKSELVLTLIKREYYRLSTCSDINEFDYIKKATL